ncbi:uncharacterized protein LOC132713927 [Ruditapes philippinarum]|uniref:uncharacterized protein LOC132713927 n=1 Tax=Ruditapes philippinarum TaxID=129788 RepID=UPI00295A8C69|nr:uncharacterized protein LOC132713927 [Ruditapes philippinarum]
MSGILKGLVFFIAFTFFKVSGVDFTFSKDKVLLGSTGTLTMTCDVTETDVDIFYHIWIYKLTSATRSVKAWQVLAKMQFINSATISLSQDIEADSKDYVARGSWNSTSPANTYLTLSMNIQKLVCDDARAYKCEMYYKSSTTGTILKSEKNATYSAYDKQSSGETNRTMSITDGNDISIAAGAIAAIVIGSLIVGVLIGAVCIWLVLKRKRTVTGLTNQDQHQSTSVPRETELNDPSFSPNTYEQLQNRTETESRMTYDLLDASANSSAVPNSQSQYEGLEREARASHTYADLKLGR